MSINYNKKEKRYRVTNDFFGIKKSFSEGKFGKYARTLAEIADNEGIIYKNYIIRKSKHSIIKIFSKKYGYFDILIDNEDVERVAGYT